MAFSIVRNVNAMPIIFGNTPEARLDLTPSAPHRWGTIKGVFDMMMNQQPIRDHGLHIYFGLTLDSRGNPIVVVCRMRDGSLKAYISSDYVAIHTTHLDYIKHAIYKIGVKRGNWESKTQVELMTMFTTTLAITMEDLLPEGQKATSKSFLEAEREILKPKPVPPVVATSTSSQSPEDFVTLTLENPGTLKLQVIKLIKELTVLDLKESKDLVDNAPSLLFSGIRRIAALDIKRRFDALGAFTTIKELGEPKVMGISPKNAQNKTGWEQFFKDVDAEESELIPSPLADADIATWINALGTTGEVVVRTGYDRVAAQIAASIIAEEPRNQQPPSSVLSEEERILQDQLDAEIQSML